ncbi:hypothetical protein CR513_19359, partial [Mucuna pruriens]
MDVGLPTDFKTLEFDKYKGSSCPRVHLAMYCRKMVTYIYDDKILVHCFQDSLTGAALGWYVSLERGASKHGETWRKPSCNSINTTKIWRRIAPDSKTWSRKNKKVSKSMHRDGASWRRRFNHQ